MKKRPIFLFAAANDAEGSLRLGEEQNVCWNELAGLHQEGKIDCHRMGFATLEQIYREFNRFNNQIYLFHYSGHSNSEIIKLHDAAASAENLGAKIGQQKNIKLVFLNGCKNYDQVDTLLKRGVPAIIATTANIEDQKAIVLAHQFYQSLASGYSIQDSFTSAKSFMFDKYPELKSTYRTLSFLERDNSEFSWGLYSQDDTVLTWHIGNIDQQVRIQNSKIIEPDEIIRQIKLYLKKRYKKRLSQKLAGRQPVNLRISVSGEGTSTEAQEMFVDSILINEEVQTKITKIFEDAYERLLIVGCPGSGKTTLLLQLALGILAKKQMKIPVLLNLASWQSSYGTFDKWLSEILWLELGVSRPLAKQMLEDAQFILLLDGLDEIAKEDRNSCLEALGQYGAVAEHYYVICSRIEEYKQSDYDAPVHLQIEVCPLTDKQIRKELNQIGRRQPEVVPMLHALKKDPILSSAVETPFYFNTAQFLFAGGKKWSDWNFIAREINGRKEEILVQFLQMQLNASGEKNYPQEKIQHWLSFLARQMKRDHLAHFELINLQPYWWIDKKNQLSDYNRIYGLFFGLTIGIIFGVYLGLDYGFAVGLGSTPIFSLIFSAVLARVFDLLPSFILIRLLPPSKYISVLFSGLILGFIHNCFIFGLVLSYGFNRDFYINLGVDYNIATHEEQLFFFYFILHILGSFFGLVFGARSNEGFFTHCVEKVKFVNNVLS